MSDPRLQAYREILESGSEPEFRPHFATRVEQRITAETNGWEGVYRSLRFGFTRFAAASAVAAAALTVYSLTGASGLDVYGSALESLLGLPTASIETVLQFIEV